MSELSIARKKLREERVLLALTLTVFVLAALASSLFYFHLDLTEERSYTFSQVTRDLYKEIPQTVFVTYYVSNALAERYSGPKSVEDFLRELEVHGKGHIRVMVADPSDNPGRVEALGVYPQSLPVVEKNETRVTTVYSGIVVEYLNDSRVLPAVVSTDNLEYEIVKAVRGLVRGAVPVAALLEGDGDKNPETDYTLLRSELRRSGYEVRDIARGSAIDPDVSVLFLLGNSALESYDAYFIDQYLGSGGRVFAAARGVRVDPDRGLLAQPLGKNAILDLLAAYGVNVKEELVLDSYSLTVPFQTEGPQGGVIYKYVRYPHWIVIDPRNVDAAHPITARFAGLDLYWPSPIEVSKKEGLTYVPLVRSTTRAWKQTKNFAAGPEDEALYRDEADTTGGQYVLAAAVSGVFPSAFEGRTLPRAAGKEEVPLLPRDRRRPGRLVVVGSSDFLTDLAHLSQSEFNVTFAVNAADWLTSDSDMPMPVGASQIRKLKPIENPADRSLGIGTVYIVSILLVPGFVVVFALVRSGRRRRGERLARAGAKGMEQ